MKQYDETHLLRPWHLNEITQSVQVHTVVSQLAETNPEMGRTH